MATLVRLTNNARTTLAVSVSAAATTIRVPAGHGARFPTIEEVGQWFPLVLEDDLGNIEITHATARTGDAITVKRGQELTPARAYTAGDACELRLTVEALKGFGGGDDGLPLLMIENAIIEAAQ